MIGLPKAQPRQADAAPRAARPGMMHSLRVYPAFRMLMVGTLATNTAFWMYLVAVGWLALDLTDSPTFVGMAGFAGGIPVLVLSIPAGVLIDRYDGRRVLLGAQAGVMLFALGFATAIMLDLMRPWLVLVLAFLYGSAMSFVFPARSTIVPSLVSREDMTNAVALNSAVQNVTRVIGPSVAGILIATTGIGATFAFAAAMQVFALYSTFQLPSSTASGSRRLPVTLSSLTVGFKVIANSPFLTGLVLLALAPTVLVIPYINLMPVFARDVLDVGSNGLGMLLTATGIGTVFGALVVAQSGGLQSSSNAQFVTVIFFTIFVILFALTENFPLALLLLFLAGFMSAAWLALNQTAVQLSVTDDVRGRVLSVYMTTWGMLPVGQLFVGVLADVLSPGTAVAISCLLSIGCVVLIRMKFARRTTA